ncbi:MAG: DNA polymerase III subunit alpha [Nocardioides sp.]|nr:DNA polymerase III subunit alpha [Nocardioides sp.]
MPPAFPHLHVSSGWSMRYGVSHPEALVGRAADLGLDVLALTDRDGTYGAVRFARACEAAGVRPVLGVRLAYRPLPDGRVPRAPSRAQRRRPAPARGGAFRDLPLEAGGLPRVTVLATSDGPGGGRAGWAALCRLVSAVRTTGDRATPALDLADPPAAALAALAGGALVVLLGPDSVLGPAVRARRDDQARAEVDAWRALVPAGRLRVEVVSHRAPVDADGSWGSGSVPHARRTLALAAALGLTAVLTNAVRYAGRSDAAVADVLDADRRLVVLHRRHLERRNAEAHLKSSAAMTEVAAEVAGAEAAGLLAATRDLAERCVLDPRADLGLGEMHVPEHDPVVGSADAVLRARCEAAVGDRYGSAPRQVVWKRLDDELVLVRDLGCAAYFLAVADVTDLVRSLGVRCAARGSGAGSILTYLLGISGVDPVRHGLLVERFLSPRRRALPDIDLDVESARRDEVYDAVLAHFGADRCVCVSMTDTYRVRHAVRAVGGAFGLPVGEVDALAKGFPRVRARDARAVLGSLPELRALGVDEQRLQVLLALTERLDGLPRHVSVHPCGVLLSDATLLDRTPVERSAAGYPMSQFDKDDVEHLGLLKLDLLGIRMQSAMAHAVTEVRRTTGTAIDLDDRTQVPLDDPATYALISSARTLGVFQLESPGQRELVGRSGIEDLDDVVADISLFRPGPVQSDMVTPYLEAKQGWRLPQYAHPDLRPVLAETRGVVVYHEQVIRILAELSGTSYAEADQRRRELATEEGREAVRRWWCPLVRSRGYPEEMVEGVWATLAAFGSFGFCKAHAAAFALTTYHSAWLKTHWPAHFLAGVLTHDPGMYPKRLLLEEARRLDVAVLGLDVNASGREFLVEPVDDGWGVRVALADVRGISDDELDRVLAHRPYVSLADLWQRARPTRPVAERLVLAGGLDSVHGLRPGDGVRRRGGTTRRDLLLQVAGLDRGRTAAGHPTLDLPVGAQHDGPSGLPELTAAETTAAELEVLGLDVSRHVVDEHARLLKALDVVRSRDLLAQRPRAEVLVAGVEVATQSPPLRSGRRVVFVTLDDATGPVDVTFFADALEQCGRTVLDATALLVRGVLRRTGHRGVSVRATGAWDLAVIHELWRALGTAHVLGLLERTPRPERR